MLYAGTNAPNPRLAELAGSSIGSRPNLGHPGDKYNRGMVAAEQLELLAQEAICRLFALPLRRAAGRLGLAREPLRLPRHDPPRRPHPGVLRCRRRPPDAPRRRGRGTGRSRGARPAVRRHPDGRRRAAAARGRPRLRPRLMIVGGSMCLHPYDVRGVRAVADEIGAPVLYDAAHMGGLIAGGRFQQPLAEGAHAITGSTYKSFGGPPAGMILTDDAGPRRPARRDRLSGADRQLRPRPAGRAGAGGARPARVRRRLRRRADRERAGTRRGAGGTRRAGARRARPRPDGEPARGRPDGRCARRRAPARGGQHPRLRDRRAGRRRAPARHPGADAARARAGRRRRRWPS